ncbi:MAG TPA: hypothetical protein VJI12_03100 [archaeon]|nr:hypothetical protein [archaeon]
MINNFQFYLDTNAAKKASPDAAEAKSLIENAFNRMDFIDSIQINDKNATFVFEDVYEALREAGQSLMSLSGYKPYSHEALIAFMKEFYKFDEKDISAFDRYRILRNNCVYRAQKVSAETCRESIGFARIFMEDIKKEFQRRHKI